MTEHKMTNKDRKKYQIIIIITFFFPFSPEYELSAEKDLMFSFQAQFYLI